MFPAARERFGAVESVAPGHVRMALVPGLDALRCGRIVAGPTLMGLADVAG